MTDTAIDIPQIASRARAAARRVSRLDPQRRSERLRDMAAGVSDAVETILAANEQDCRDAQQAGVSAALLDRLRLDASRIESMAAGVETVAALPDRLGETISTYEHPAGMPIRRVRVPLGVILIIYESRPNVTADAAALCFKSGNAVILRGGSEAMRTNRAIRDAMLSRLADDDENGGGETLRDAIQLVPTTDRAAVEQLLTMDQDIDLVIPRGGEGLIRAVAKHSTIPVLKHYQGVCHVYVDRDADLDMARRIAVNAKCQRPGVCNAMETLLVHEQVADRFLPAVAESLREHGVELRGDERTGAIIPDALPAEEDDWSAEYLDLILAIRVVADCDEAIEHINRYGSRHSDAIVTADRDAADRFLQQVDSATVYVNASTRFTDGGEFGLGAEIGISTDKLHARGPCGIEALTTYKYIIDGDGQVRE